MKMMIAYSLCGDMIDDLSKDNPEYPQYACSFLMYAHEGKISRLEYEDVYKDPNVKDVEVDAWFNKEIAEDGSTGQKVFRIKLVADTVADVVNTVKYIQSVVVVEDENGRDMLFKPFDSEILLNA